MNAGVNWSPYISKKKLIAMFSCQLFWLIINEFLRPLPWYLKAEVLSGFNNSSIRAN